MMTLGEFIIAQQNKFAHSTGELSALFGALRLAAKLVNREVNQAGLIDDIEDLSLSNSSGEKQKRLDVLANDTFKAALIARGVVCGLASEEEESFVAFDNTLNQNAKYVVLIDPLDGSSNIDVNVSVGTIFSIYRRVSPVGTTVTLDDFFQPGTQQVAAGYIIYGSSTMLVYSSGEGVNGFSYDPSLGVFILSHENMRMPEDGTIYSVNEGGIADFPEAVRQYIAYCKEEDADTARPYSARYVGSLVADFHRNLLKGGIYFYPQSRRYPEGKLRLLYECNPIAFLAKQAGGRAIAGPDRDILSIQPKDLHQRTPFVVGSSNMVAMLESFMQRYPKR